ncbi:MAG: hypothetical protein EAZ85_16350 [Bacteroidetes bacterium]|nr:MAG: hypothetical protein EAZ85_16350 [Bacteroidota bacterium]TAG95079.1 MAG: hypothetical protein EAZ20_00480 [Bacteroidota bacterium]
MIIIISTNVFAQNPEKFRERLEQKRQEIDNLKKEIVESQLNLKPEQIEPFRKLYDEYSWEKIQIRRKIIKAKRTNLNLTSTDEDLNKNIDEMLGMKQKEVEIEKAYKIKFLKIINIRQLAEIYRSEQEFIGRLMDLAKPRNKRLPKNMPEED